MVFNSFQSQNRQLHKLMLKMNDCPPRQLDIWMTFKTNSSCNWARKTNWTRCGALIFFICALTNNWAQNRDAGDLRRNRGHYDGSVMRLNVRIRFQSPWFKSCIQQRKTTCLLSILKSLACARASKLTTTNMHIARARRESQMAVG